VRRYLVDTHVLLWWLGGQPKKLGRAARRAVEAAGAGSAELLISVVSL
jgi:PIN domain nuclease of toxin-antitoxin system